MSRWHEFRKCGNCKYFSAACYQGKQEVLGVHENRPACKDWSPDMPREYVPVGKYGDVWDVKA